MRPPRTRSVRTPYMPKTTVPVVPSIFDHARGHAQLLEILSRLDAKEKALDAKLVKADTALNQVHEKVQSAHQAVGRISEVHDTIRYIAGKDGEDGEDGKDADENTIIDRVLDNIRQPEDGKTPIIDYPKIVAEVTRQIKVRDGKDATVDYDRIFDDIKKKLKVEHIPGVKEELDNFSRQVAGKVYGKDTWTRGGGDTVQAGSNVTITTNSDGRKVISASGGSASPLTPTGTVNSVNTVFNVVSRPSSVVSDGITYFEGAGYVYAALSITLDVPPSQYIRYYA